jgi:hypothetical protein
MAVNWIPPVSVFPSVGSEDCGKRVVRCGAAIPLRAPLEVKFIAHSLWFCDVGFATQRRCFIMMSRTLCFFSFGWAVQEKVDEIRSQVKFQLKKVLCMGVAVGHVEMSEADLRMNITLSINFLVSTELHFYVGG